MATRLSLALLTIQSMWADKPLPPQPIWTQLIFSLAENFRIGDAWQPASQVPAAASEVCLINERRVKVDFIVTAVLPIRRRSAIKNATSRTTTSRVRQI